MIDGSYPSTSFYERVREEKNCYLADLIDDFDEFQWWLLLMRHASLADGSGDGRGRRTDSGERRTHHDRQRM